MCQIPSKWVVNVRKTKKFDVYVGRWCLQFGDSGWGNPFTHLKNAVKPGMTLCPSREEAVAKYREWIYSQPDLIQLAKMTLRGKILGCWCVPDLCHAEILADIANAPEPETEVVNA